MSLQKRKILATSDGYAGGLVSGIEEIDGKG
jgi:hypothetical protein